MIILWSLPEIEINKFKSIDKLSLTIEGFLAIIGENNAAKSNILKAIQLFWRAIFV